MHASSARTAFFLLAWAAIGALAAAPASGQERIGTGALSREGGAGIRVYAVIGGAERPQTSGQVSAIPYDRALPTVQLAIKGIGARAEQNCTSLTLYNWTLELADVADVAYLAYRAGQQGDLGEVVILYPPRPQAKAMAPGSVRPGELPRSSIPSDLYAAFDFDADGRPDLVEMRTCCGRLNPDKTCVSGDSCVKTYRRGSRGWRLVNQREEC